MSKNDRIDNHGFQPKYRKNATHRETQQEGKTQKRARESSVTSGSSGLGSFQNDAIIHSIDNVASLRRSRASNTSAA